MPLYTALIEEGSVPDQSKTKIAEEITDTHAAVMKVPRSFVRVIFLSYPKGSGYAAGEQVPAAAVDCTLRNGHCRRKDAASDASVGDISTPYGGRDESSRNITPGKPVDECDGDGTDHEPRGSEFQ